MIAALPSALLSVLATARAVDEITVGATRVPRIHAELWTAGQRQAHSLHEVSYRACFKPQLPHFFIERFSTPGDVVYDPFAGRGTTALESALLGRNVVLNDVNPLTRALALPRLNPPTVDEVDARLEEIFAKGIAMEIDDGPDLSMFYETRTLQEIHTLRAHLCKQHDSIDAWIRMVATNRLTGHSSGFFSVYTLPPNQAVSAERQRKINARLKQSPQYRDTRKIILRKTRALLKDVTDEDRRTLRKISARARAFTQSAGERAPLRSGTVQLTVTSPPFLDVVHYASDNWLRLWFNAIDKSISDHITMTHTISGWQAEMQNVFQEMYRLTRADGWVVFEVGEVRGGKIRLDEVVLPLGAQAGFVPVAVLVNTQSFTKTANIWGVNNNTRGTNSNRIVLFRKA